MHILRFCDCGFAWNLPKDAQIIDCVSGDRQNRSIEEIFHSIADTHLKPLMGNDGVYLINAHGCFTPDATRQALEGVEILKHIRLTEWLGEMRRWHAILFSLEPVENILRRKPNDLIIISPGVTFLRLPEALDLEDALAHVSKNTEGSSLVDLATRPDRRLGEDSDLYPFVACDYVPPSSDHAISNWWGARQLIAGVEKITRSPYSPEGFGNVAVERELKKLANKKAFALAQAPRWEPGFFLEDKNAMNGAREIFARKAPPRLLYIDDEMENGWNAAVYFALTGKNSTDYPAWFHTTLKPQAFASKGLGGWDALASDILGQKPEIILTDLRLLGALESDTQVGDTSGAKLVSFLRKRAPAIPILLMTASNKASTLGEAFRLGVDGYWMKEGIGDHSSPTRSLQNTASLMGSIARLAGPDYQLLRRIHVKIDEFKRTWNTNNPPWWKEMATWPSPSHPLKLRVPPPPVTKPDRDRALFLLESTVRMYREYLRLQHFGSADFSRGETMDFWMRPLIVHVGRIVECIHCFDEIRRDIDPKLSRPDKLANGGTIGGRSGCSIRRDWFGQGLYEVRNIAAHFNPDVTPISSANLRSLLSALFAWLSVPPPCERRATRPYVEHFFNDSSKQRTLVRAYTDLFGYDRLCLPRWEE